MVENARQSGAFGPVIPRPLQEVFFAAERTAVVIVLVVVAVVVAVVAVVVVVVAVANVAMAVANIDCGMYRVTTIAIEVIVRGRNSNVLLSC